MSRTLESSPERPDARVAGLVVLALAGAFGALATGGLTGPLAVLCLAPLAASGWKGGAPVGAALATAAAGVLALAGLLGLVGPEPTGFWAAGLALAAVATVAALLGGAVVRRLRSTSAAQPAAPRLLVAQPGLSLETDGAGAILFSLGAAPAGVDRAALGALPALARAEDRPRVLAALRSAVEVGAAEVAFQSTAGTDLRLRLRRAAEGRLAGVLTDASAERGEREALETARAAAEAANVAKSRFLADMSHELRTPLNAIIGFSDVMRARLFGELPERYREYPDSIHQSGRHLLDLINDLLDLSKIEAEKYELHREALDAREPVEAALRLIAPTAEKAGVVVRSTLGDAPLAATLDKRAATQIALNLLSNAVKFTPAGGTVTVTLAEAEGELVLMVADTGVGVSAEELARLGRPYEQAAAGRERLGTGLGLALVRALAELHGGRLELASVEGEGLTATVRLPAAVETAADNVIPFTGRG